MERFEMVVEPERRRRFTLDELIAVTEQIKRSRDALRASLDASDADSALHAELQVMVSLNESQPSLDQLEEWISGQLSRAALGETPAVLVEPGWVSPQLPFRLGRRGQQLPAAKVQARLAPDLSGHLVGSRYVLACGRTSCAESVTLKDFALESVLDSLRADGRDEISLRELAAMVSS